MPWNSKKKKAAKKKNQKQSSPKDPDPNPSSQGKGKEDEIEETFMTPRSQLDPVDLLPRIDDIDGSSVVESSNFREVKLKDTKLEESVIVNEIPNRLDVEINSNLDESAKETILPEIAGESQKDHEVLKEMKLDEFVQPLEKSVHVDDGMIPEVLIEVGDSSLSPNEKEVKVVPLTAGEIIVNEDADDNVEVVRFGKGSAVEGNTDLEREILKDESLKEVQLDVQRIPVFQKSREEIGLVQQVLPQVDVNSNDKMVDKSIDKSSVPVENSAIHIEETSQHGKGHNESVISATDVSFRRKTNNDADKTEIAHKNKVAHGPPVVSRATLWNCCGLLEILRSTDG